jgi:hypothetical protein
MANEDEIIWDDDVIIIIIINFKWVYTWLQCATMQDRKIYYNTIQ